MLYSGELRARLRGNLNWVLRRAAGPGGWEVVIRGPDQSQNGRSNVLGNGKRKLSHSAIEN